MRNSKNKWSDSADKVMMHDHNMFDDSIKHVSGFGWTKSPLDTPFDSFTDDLYQWGNSGGCVSVILFINSRFPCLCNAGLIPYMYVHWLPFKKGLWRHVSVDKLLAKCFHTASVDQPLSMAKKVRLFTELPYSITIQMICLIDVNQSSIWWQKNRTDQSAMMPSSFQNKCGNFLGDKK